MKHYAYLMDDPNWPPEMHEIVGRDEETELLIVSPVENPQRVLYLYPENIWQLT
jgi:hypothetical protein